MTSRSIALLRAVNVGKRTVPMAELRELLERIGYRDVWTFLNSGNAIFDGTGQRRSEERAIEAALQQTFGFEVETFVRAEARIAELARARPFGELDDADTHLVGFVRSPLDAAAIDRVTGLATDRDELQVDGAELHWHIRGKSMDSGIKPAAWKHADLGPMTTRNITMVRKLAAKLEG